MSADNVIQVVRGFIVFSMITSVLLATVLFEKLVLPINARQRAMYSKAPKPIAAFFNLYFDFVEKHRYALTAGVIVLFGYFWYLLGTESAHRFVSIVLQAVSGGVRVPA